MGMMGRVWLATNGVGLIYFATEELPPNGGYPYEADGIWTEFVPSQGAGSGAVWLTFHKDGGVCNISMTEPEEESDEFDHPWHRMEPKGA